MTPEDETIARYEALRLRLGEILSLADQIDEELIALESKLPPGYRSPDEPTSQRCSVVTLSIGKPLDADARWPVRALREAKMSNYRILNIPC